MNLLDVMRPQTFADIVGQPHLTEDNALLVRLLVSGNFDSLMFVGPPGTGKTSMAKIAGKTMGIDFYSLHSTVSGTAEIKKIIEASKCGIKSLVFIDEIHRYNKSQQDLLLKLIDDRVVKLIGASAENPYYNLIPALRSRSLIFEFKKVSVNDLRKLSIKAIEYFKQVYNVENVDISKSIEYIIRGASGDVRRFLNLLELSAMLGVKKGNTLICECDGLENLISNSMYSKDEHYDILSAMIKSIRGSDPDAALLWCMKLVKNGVSPEEIYRRLMVSASEDIGNAFPDALVFINSSYNSFLNVGVPEGLIILAHSVVFLASCPKSNKSYEAYHDVMDYLSKNDPVVPKNICHNSEGYKYPFNYGTFIKQKYLPDKLQFYFPIESGFEIKIRERLDKLWNSIKKYE